MRVPMYSYNTVSTSVSLLGGLPARQMRAVALLSRESLFRGQGLVLLLCCNVCQLFIRQLLCA